jgi:tetratricopeptide (TPR) repeat protein
MIPPRSVVRALPWWAAVFLLALAARLAFLWVTDGPIVFGHERVYFNKGLWIAEHPDPWRFILREEAWRSWAGPHWTLPPLYPLFVAAFLRAWGTSLPALLVLQAVLGALAAVGVGRLGREVDPGRGAWAGAAYAVYWPAVILPSTTLTENLHTTLLVWSLALVAAAARTGAVRTSAAGGVLLGVSALARTVSLAFAPLAAAVHLRWRGGRPGAKGALALVAGCAAAVAPWTARNVALHGELIVVDTVSAYNLWYDNLFVNEDRARMQQESIEAQTTLGAKRRRAAALAMRNLARSPQTMARKVWDNARYFFRPEALDALLRVEYPHPGWVHAGWVAFGDVPFLLALPLFAVYAVAGRPSPARSVVVLWSVYYLVLLVVVFHAQLRYRSAWTPVLFAGAAGGLAPLPAGARRRATAALAGGAALALLTVAPYVPTAWAAFRSERDLRRMRAALAREDAAAAERAARDAAAHNPSAARPWLRYGQALAAGGRAPEAIAAYERAARANPGQVVPVLALPQLLREAGRAGDAEAAQARADAAARAFDAWWALEVAWRELPPPLADEVRLARGDLGAVRGFLDARRAHRWTRHRALVRLRPARAADVYDVSIEMGSPPPSPRPSPLVTVRVGGASARFVLTPDVRAYTLRARVAPGAALVVEIEAPTWTRMGELPEQGVRVDRVAVTPVNAPG